MAEREFLHVSDRDAEKTRNLLVELGIATNGVLIKVGEGYGDRDNLIYGHTAVANIKGALADGILHIRWENLHPSDFLNDEGEGWIGIDVDEGFDCTQSNSFIPEDIVLGREWWETDSGLILVFTLDRDMANRYTPQEKNYLVAELYKGSMQTPNNKKD